MSEIHEILRRPRGDREDQLSIHKLLQYVFEVAPNATRTMVKDAIETMFDVNVVRVNVLRAAPKRGRRARSRRLLVRKPAFKKAIVTLAEGQTLEIFEGVK